MTRNPVYGHPDVDGAVEFDTETRRLFVLNDSESACAYAVIGTAGMRIVAAKLMALADELEAHL